MPLPKAGYPAQQAWSVFDVLQIVIEGMNEGTNWALVRHYHVGVISDNETIADNVSAFWQNDILPAMQALLTDQWTAQCGTVSRAGPYPRTPEFSDFGAGITGAVATDGVPNGSALLLKFTTDTPTARGRGRMYVPGLPEAATNAGRLLAASQAAWDAVAALIKTNIVVDGNTIAPCVYSRTAHGALPNLFTQQQWIDAEESISPIMSNAIVIANLASQRDRRAKRQVFG